MGLPAKCMHFVGSPGWRGSQHITRETKSLFGASPSTTNTLSEPPPPRDEQHIRGVPEHDEYFEPR